MKEEGEKQLELCRVSYVPALYKMFDEVLVNATDNARRDPKGQTFIRVRVDTQRNTITVHNDGATVPAVWHEREKCYIPQLVFGQLLTGSNFEEETGGWLV